MAKIAILNSLYHPHHVGGAEVSVRLLAVALRARGHGVFIVTLAPKDAAVDTVDGIAVHRIPLQNAYWPHDGKARSVWAKLFWHAFDISNTLMGRKVGRLLDVERPDVLLTNNLTGFSASVWKEARKRSIPTVHVLRDYSLLCAKGTMFRDGHNCLKQCAECKLLSGSRRRESGQVDSVVGISRYVLDTHLRLGFFSHSSSTVILNPADSNVPTRAPRPVRNLSYFGRIEAAKGIEQVLLATTRLKQGNWILNIFGRGVPFYVEDLQRRFPDPRIRWRGFCDKELSYSQTDLIVVPSLWNEPLSRVVIEAGQRGIPLICASSGGIPEVAAVFGNCTLYDGEDVGMLAASIDAAIAGAPMQRPPTAPERWQSLEPDAVAANYEAVALASLPSPNPATPHS